MAKLQPVRGTHDLLPEDSRRHRRVIEQARGLAEQYGYGEISTPIFEFAEVFKRTLGDTSDIVTKEMYTFEDRSGAQITLRPENTAGVARALISGGLAQHLPLKYFYAGPMFRYERPQKGRLRQFHQIGIELMGVAEPIGDIEIIALGAHILEALGVQDETTLEINTLGDTESRAAYRTALVDYLSSHESALSAESRERLGRNPFRVLDSKNEGDREIVAGAPMIDAYLNTHSAAIFEDVLNGLNRMGIAYHRNPHLVRGLDYYCHTAFEFTTSSLGAQGAVIAGGRYDGLVKTMGGPPTPGVGWAGGVERLALMVGEIAPAARPVALVPIGETAAAEASLITHRLRHLGYTVELAYRGNLTKRLKRANQLNAAAAVIIGDDELAAAAATVRDLDSGEQRSVPLDQLAAALEAYR